MTAKIRAEVRRVIARERDAGYPAIDVMAVRNQLAKGDGDDKDERDDLLTALIMEECANTAMPVLLEPIDLSEKSTQNPGRENARP
ncbi:hypothetical protein [Aurantimonas coralicida]|uniref:hypothetical protein n=1 Tax=Aurantimonas coralicida TaxID=182270 RepID=UPI001E43271F|nr:hypothetical protein [Aurantimonas coralicida]MCD1645644.1 hypothetical protein [Aurantimonas coralicida]|tara:strand:- start:248 stop:505 length:258 start_codon:yes stop_codon:yes gene_type:complete